jgi:RhtB (resistance to homoserine/threonine) family protein
MTSYWTEFFGLMAVFSVLIVAPGADFALIIRQCIVHGRRAAIITSVGVGCSLLFHIGYTILGIGLIVSKSLFLFSLMKWAGAAYLIWLGIKALREPALGVQIEEAQANTDALPAWKLFALGFVTNALNPKPVLFFLSLFSILVSPHTPHLIQLSYGLGMAGALIAWFVAVSFVFTGHTVRARFLEMGRWFNRVAGALFIGLGVRLAMAEAAKAS